MLTSTWFLIILSIKILNHADGAKILGIFPVNSKSHFSISEPIIKALAARGHQVDVISAYQPKSTIKNYTEINFDKESRMTFLDSMTVDRTKNHIGIWNNLRCAESLEEQTCIDILQFKYIQRLIRSKKKMIDLLIVEMHYTRCYTLLAYKLNVPIIVISPTSINFGTEYFTGNPINPSHVPLIYRPATTEMNFLQRFSNTIDYIVSYYYVNFIFDKHLSKVSKEIFNMELPPQNVLSKQIAMIFFNNHFSFTNRPINPNFIEVAGIHITEAKKLPTDLQDFIDASNHGVIFFSFGSTIKASSMDSEKLNLIKEVFSAIPQRVLWRVNELNITDVPSNVKLSKWFPQRDILEHKNVIAFISHCGLFSTLEAIHTATPVIGIPFMFDQFQDAKILEEREVGVYLDYDTMDKETFAGAINEIVNNKKYRDNMRKLSSIFRDRPISQLDEAVYWSEYVLKHNGARHLRTQAVDMPLYQYLLLDVITFVLAFMISFLYLCKFILKTIFSIFNENEMKKKKVL